MQPFTVRAEFSHYHKKSGSFDFQLIFIFFPLFRSFLIEGFRHQTRSADKFSELPATRAPEREFLNNATAQRCAPRPNANAWAQESYLGQHVPSEVALLIWRHDPSWFPSGWILERVAQVCSHRRVSQLWRSTKVMGGEQRWGWRVSLFHSYFCFHSGKVVK